MTNDKGILIRNVYYMLSYAFSSLRKNNYEDVAKEDFERIEDLFAEILYKGISAQLKLGLYREYIHKTAELPLLRGKLDINKLGKYKNNTITNDVIITEERIKHIKEHHPGDYENYSRYIQEIIT